MGNDRDTRWCDAAFMTAIFFGVFGLLVLFHIPWPRTPAEWAGGKPPVEVLALVITPLGALGALAGVIVSARSNAKTLRQAVAGDRANRFQKGVELLTNSSSVGNVGGMALLGGVAREEPETFLVPVLHALIGFVFEQDKATKTTMAFHMVPFRPYEGAWPEGSKATADALSAISALAKRDAPHWPASIDVTFNGRLMVASVYLAGLQFTGETLPSVHFRRTVVHSTSFTRADFRDTVWQLHVGKLVEFIACDLRGASFTVRDETNELLPSEETHRISFEGCRTESMTYNDMPFVRP